MIKILHIMPSISINNGMMSVIINYHKHIDRTKVQFDYLYFFENDGNHLETINQLGGKAYFIGAPRPTVRYFKKIDAFFSKHGDEYTAIHCHPIFASELFGRNAKRHGIKHIIAHSHSTKYSNKKISAIRNYIINLFIGHFATDYMACSKDASKLFGRAIKNKNVYILNNAIDCDNFLFDINRREEIRSSFHIQGNETVFGHVGRFTNEKNHKFLIDVFNEYKKLNVNSKLILVGDGPLIEGIKKHINSLNLTGNVIFAGRRTDIPALLSAMDIFILPSLFEGVPVAVVEAQTSGLPCFISDTITKSVNFSNCTYLSIKKPALFWANTILNSSCNKDRIEGARLAKKSNFNINIEAERLCEFYLKLGD